MARMKRADLSCHECGEPVKVKPFKELKTTCLECGTEFAAPDLNDPKVQATCPECGSISPQDVVVSCPECGAELKAKRDYEGYDDSDEEDN